MATTIQSGEPTTESTETVEPSSTASANGAGTTTGEMPASEPVSEPAAAEEDGANTEGSQPDPAKQALLADLHKERSSRKALQAQLEKVTADLENATGTTEQLTVMQTKYNRLEEFLLKMGGPISKALDSRAFTAKLFESEDNIDDLVASWNHDNPSPTTVALGSAGTASSTTPKMNDLLRIAAK